MEPLGTAALTVENAMRRLVAVRERIIRTTIRPKDTLLRLINSELSFLRRISASTPFFSSQVNSEVQSPVISELSAVISGKRGIICQSVYQEFQELISIYGGPNEKLRAKCLQKLLKVVPDCQSKRLASLKTTWKLALKNKVAFGTGDYWYALTSTANMAFVQAVSQTGMSLYVLEHRSRTRIGD